jgi:hypothetical protein
MFGRPLGPWLCEIISLKSVRTLFPLAVYDESV